MVPATQPGQVLFDQFMQPRRLSQNALARAIEVPPRRINEIILGKRKITADTDLRLCKYFGLEPGFWLQIQVTSDLTARKELLKTALDKLPAVDDTDSYRASFYARLARRRNDGSELQACVEEVAKRLESQQTSEDRPGMLLGRIQSGKTRAFIGVTAKAFDRGFDIAVILTKGTKTLAAQTVARLNADFNDEIETDEILVFDIMKPPGRLIKGDLRKKLIIVAKKQVDNLERLNRLFEHDYSSLAAANVLLIDDEADLASIRFLRRAGVSNVEQGMIAEKLVEFGTIVKSTAFLQVTATPYSLYLQPERYFDHNNDPIYKPMKPAFTVLLPMHSGYVGGDTYFGARTPGTVEGYLFVPVSLEEQNALRSNDRRRIKASNVLETPNAAGLTRAVVTFVLAACVRQWQQREALERRTKYAMVIHNDTQKAAHSWQHSVVEWITQAITSAVEVAPTSLDQVFGVAYQDLSRSVAASGGQMPDIESAFEMFTEAFQGDEVVRETVNSDQDVLALLDDKAELRLRTSFNIFNGGSILDRGITIPNLISFYYGRNPQTTQADTVLQHSRMYGNRSRADVAVTRLYTSPAVYGRMYTINSFETTLREAFEKGAHDQGVVFIRADGSGRVRPCGPDKLLLSDLVAVRPGGFYLPTGFLTKGAHVLSGSDRTIRRLIPTEVKKGNSVEIELKTAIEIIDAIEPTLEMLDKSFDWTAMKALLEFYSRKPKEKVDLFVEIGRRLDRQHSGDKSGLSIIGTALRDTLRNPSRRKPALVLLQQVGTIDLNWGGHSFWWPVLAAPPDAEPCVFATKIAA